MSLGSELISPAKIAKSELFDVIRMKFAVSNA
jgi:hypothetical protein